MRVPERTGAAEIEHDSTADGLEGQVRFVLSMGEVDRLRDLLSDASAGDLRAEEEGEKVIFRAVADGGSQRFS